MSWIEIILIGAGLSLDVFAYALCRGAVVGEIDKKSLVILGGGFTLWNLISLTAGNFVAKIPVVSKNAEYAANDWKYISHHQSGKRKRDRRAKGRKTGIEAVCNVDGNYQP